MEVEDASVVRERMGPNGVHAPRPCNSCRPDNVCHVIAIAFPYKFQYGLAKEESVMLSKRSTSLPTGDLCRNRKHSSIHGDLIEA